MVRSLSSSLLGVFALLLVLQGVFAFIEPGRYLIITEEERFLSIGPVPLVWPPIDVPARLLDRRFHDEAWEVREVEGGYTIRQPGDRPGVYGLVQRDDAVFVSATSESQTWAVNNAGNGLYTIGAANEDLLFTQSPDKFPQVLLTPSDGSNNQRFRFVQIERDPRAFGRLYRKGRFNRQCAM